MAEIGLSHKEIHEARQTRDAELKACEIRLRAERRAGQLLAESEKAKGLLKRGAELPRSPNGTAGQTLADMGISKKQSSNWQRLAAVPDDQFERLFANHPDPLPEPVNCSPSTARRLMMIAGHKGVANRAHAHVLPPSWTTLYELTKLPEDKLEIALAEGWVRPETQRSDVKEIRERLGIESRPRQCPKRADRA